MKMDAPLSVPHCYGRSRNRDGPNDRKCSRRLLQPHPVSLWQARRSANSNLVCTVSSFKNRVVFMCFLLLLLHSNFKRLVRGALHKDWLLLCKICLSVAEFMAQKKLV